MEVNGLKLYVKYAKILYEQMFGWQTRTKEVLSKMQKKNRFTWHYCGLCNGRVEYGKFRLWQKKIICPHCGAEITYRRTITGKLKGIYMPANEYEDGIEVIGWQDKNFKADTSYSDAEIV